MKNMNFNILNQGNSQYTTSKTKSKICILIMFFLVLCVLIAGMLIIHFSNHRNNFTLSAEEAQICLDEMLMTAYNESSPDNYIAQILKENTFIRLNSIQNNKEYVMAKCTVTSLDIEKAISDYLDTVENDANIGYSTVVADLIKAVEGAKEVTQNFQVKFFKKNGKYDVRIPEEMTLFCSGNIQDLLPYIYEILSKG